MATPVKVKTADSAYVSYLYAAGTAHYNIRDHAIDTITIHHSANGTGCDKGYAANTLVVIFNSVGRSGSVQYGIDSNGRIGQMLAEEYRSWCSSDRTNDMRAITIEVANDTGAPSWHVSDKALAAVIDLCADICKRHGKKKMVWIPDKDKALAYTPKTDEMRMTLHKWFAATSCPEQYLISKMPYIAEQVTKRLGTAAPEVINAPFYRVRKSWNDAKSQIGAYASLENAKNACKKGYSVFDEKGNVVYTIATFSPYIVKVTNKSGLNIRSDAGMNHKIVGFAPAGAYTIIEEKTAGGLQWGKLKSGAGWICLTGYTKKL